ncbi:MAG: glutamate 5-kinase [Bdellovibrionales bacterium]|nr:glutamate 5-kinase [Bdellovibrionales bacterium]
MAESENPNNKNRKEGSHSAESRSEDFSTQIAAEVTQVERIVVKIGTGVLTGEDGGLAVGRLSRLLEEIFPFVSKPIQQVFIVTSGAVGLGRKRLGLEKPLTLAQKQACAAVGQSVLIQNYNMILSRFGLMAGQILVTSADFLDPLRRANLMASLNKMETFPVVPVINENDVISTEELEPLGELGMSFGDNDRLSALLALQLKAQLLVMVTESEGIYLSRPKSEDEKPLGWVSDLSVLDRVEVWGHSQMGKGGVSSKIKSARMAAEGGTACWVVSGTKENQMTDFFRNLNTRQAPLKGTFVVGEGSIWKQS